MRAGRSPCLTLAEAVDAHSADDTVQVGPGQFNISGDATFTKSLTYLGAQAGVSASQRDPANLAGETVLVPAATPVGALMMVQAKNVVVDGFVFSGNQNGWRLRTEGESGTIDFGGYGSATTSYRQPRRHVPP